MFAGKPSPLPVISIQPGASSPHVTSPLYPKTLERLKTNFLKYDIKAALVSEKEYKNQSAFIMQNPQTFCSTTAHPYIYEVRLCPLESRPADWPVKIAHLVSMDGAFYGDAGKYQ